MLDLPLRFVSVETTCLAPSMLRLHVRILGEESVDTVWFMKTSIADRPAGVSGGCMSRVCRFGKKQEELVIESLLVELSLTKLESHFSSTLSISLAERPQGSIGDVECWWSEQGSGGRTWGRIER